MKRLKLNSRGFAVAAGTVGVVAIMMAGAPPANHGIHERPSSLEVWKSGDSDPNQKIMVSLERKKLWLISGRDTLFSAPIAIGSGAVFRFANRTYRFETPRGERRILAKEEDPSWVPPDWHYYEKAVAKGLEPVHLKDGDRHELSDGTFIEVRGKEVGRINRFGNWWPFTPGTEIIFDGNIYVPELGSPQRRIPNALGPIKLVLGDGYLIHGTHRYNQQSIGTAASHGCIRMRNEDVERLSRMVNVGTRVYIY